MQHTKASYNTIIYSSHFLPELLNDNLWFEFLFSKDFQLGLPGLESVVIFCSDAHLVDNWLKQFPSLRLSAGFLQVHVLLFFVAIDVLFEVGHAAVVDLNCVRIKDLV